MAGDLIAILPTALACVATYLLHSSVLLGMAWLIIRASKTKSHVLTERIWKTAAVAGLITAPLQLMTDASKPLFRVPLVYPSGPGTADRPLVGVESHRPKKDASVAGRLGPTDSDRPDSAVVEARIAAMSQFDRNRGEPHPAAATTTTAAAEPKPPASPHASEALAAHRMTSTASAVFTVAVLCVFGGLTRLVCQTYVFRQRLAGCRPIHDGPARTLLDQLLGQLPLRRDVTLLTSVTYPEPVAFGLLRWRIVLPAGIDRKLSGDELKALLAHELAHLVRGDAVWLWIGRVLCSCCAFQPLNFLARREWRRAVEYQCDDWAVRHAVGVLSLARCLTLVAEWRLRTAVHAEALAAAGPKSVLADRVERLIEQSDRTDPWTGRFYGGALRVLGLATVLALACWGPQAVLLAKPTVSILPSNILLKKPIPSRARQQAVWKMTGKLPLPDGRGSEKHLFQRSSELADELDSLNAEIDWLEREVSELYRMVNQSPSQPGIRRVAERMRLRMAEISRRRDFLVSVLPQPGFSHHLE